MADQALSILRTTLEVALLAVVLVVCLPSILAARTIEVSRKRHYRWRQKIQGGLLTVSFWLGETLSKFKPRTQRELQARAFMSAILDGNEHNVSILLERGVDPNTTLRFTSTPIQLAVFHNQLEITHLLLLHGADIHRKLWSTSGSLLHIASERCDVEMCHLLLKFGAKVDEYDILRNTPLMNAVVRNRSEIAEVLTDAGADPDRRCFRGYSPVRYAEACNRDECLRAMNRDIPPPPESRGNRLLLSPDERTSRVSTGQKNP